MPLAVGLLGAAALALPNDGVAAVVVVMDIVQPTGSRVVRVHKGMTVVMAHTPHGVVILTLEAEAEAGVMRVLRIPLISPMVSTTGGILTGV